MQTLKINIIGAGNLGSTLGKLIVTHAAGIIQRIVNTSIASSKKAIKFIGQGEPYARIEDLPQADVTLITTADDHIAACCEALVNCKNFQCESIVLHCSGSLPAAILRAVKTKGGLVASVHPMRSFADPNVSFSQFAGTYCAIEGDTTAKNFLHDFFNKLGAVTYEINGAKKDSYHAAGVFASNYLVTLYDAALLCLTAAKVDEKIAHEIIINLMQGTLNNLKTNLSAAKSLTGPIKRGDINTLNNHLNALANGKLAELYKVLGLATVNIANLPDDKKNEVQRILNKL